MSKKFMMYVDERGFLSKNTNENITMMGIIFEYDYCIDLEDKDKECELKAKLNKYKKRILSERISEIPLDNIILDENTYGNIHMTERKKFIGELPSLIRSLDFTIISCTVKRDFNKIDESYSMVIKKLLKKFHSFIIAKNGETGGIVVEASKDKARCLLQQNFFNIYNEKDRNLSLLDNIQDKINTFIVCEKDNKTYGTGFELSNILNNILYRVLNGYREIDSNLISHMEYGNKNKIFDAVKCKIYNDVEIGIPSKQLQMISYNNVEMFSKELNILKQQILLKDTNINEKEKEIKNLANEIKLLNSQLEEVLFNRKGDNIISKIFSDMDVRFDKLTSAMKN